MTVHPKICLLALLSVTSASQAIADPPARPNILVLMAEDLSPRIGAFGDPVAVTPNLDALAGEGVRYTNTFTTAGVCAPSRAAHIMGMYQIATGTQHMRSGSYPGGAYKAVPPAHAKAYPELLRASSYYTYTDHKLDYQFSTARSGSGPFTIWDSEGETNPNWRGRAEGQPFYGLRNFMATHESGVFTPLGTWPKGIMHLSLQLYRWWLLGGNPAAVVRPDGVVVPPYYPDTPTVRRDLARHYDNIAHMDGQVGEILEQLESDGLADSTIVIWTTDHGDGLPRAKRELFDSGIRVPMIIRWPDAYRPAGVAPGSTDARLISFVDLAPTILELAGAVVPDFMQGRAFASPTASRREYVYAARDRIDEVLDRQRAVRSRRFKYIRSWYPDQPGGHALGFRDIMDMSLEMRALYQAGELSEARARWFEPVGKERLFDLRVDPYELDDVAENPSYADALVAMRAALDRWLAETADWSEEPEAVMVERFQPNGEQSVTMAPEISVVDGKMAITSASEGASIGYRVDDGVWRLYVGPFEPPGGDTLEAKAVRYGWEESEITKRPLP